MIDPLLLAGACVVVAVIVLGATWGIYGVVCCIAQCVRHCKKIWRKQ